MNKSAIIYFGDGLSAKLDLELTTPTNAAISGTGPIKAFTGTITFINNAAAGEASYLSDEEWLADSDYNAYLESVTSTFDISSNSGQA